MLIWSCSMCRRSCAKNHRPILVESGYWIADTGNSAIRGVRASACGVQNKVGPKMAWYLWYSAEFSEILQNSVDFCVDFWEVPSINPSFSWYKQYIPGKSLFQLHLVWGNIVRWQVEHLVFDYQNARGSDHIPRSNFTLCSIKTLVSCYR